MTKMPLNEKFLAHYGVKGMKWGVVRDNIKANPRGAALKTAGVVNNLRKTGVRNKAQARDYVRTSADHKVAEKIRLKQKVAGVQTLSNRDLQQVIQRMNLEMQYKNLKKAEFEDSYLGAGQKFIGSLLRDVAVDVASSWFKRPGSNFTGRTSSRAVATIGRGAQKAIGS